jgi:hypothetical protein
MRVSIFDFDNTLVKLPYEEEDDYMDTMQSVECIKKVNKSVYSDYVNHLNDDVVILLTNRTEILKENVISFLDKHNMRFDVYMFRTDSHCKGDRIENFIKENLKSIDMVEFWDDKEKHIIDVKRVLDKYSLKYKLHLVNEH